MNPSIHTQAFNFSSAVQSGVDPRTGLYGSQIALTPLVGNALRGPHLNLALSYSPWSQGPSLFGEGWCLGGLSFYDRDTKTLSLSTGEQYKVKESQDRVWIPEQKLKSFRFEKLEDTYRVIHKSGLVESLKIRSGYSLQVTDQIIAPTGHCLTVAWEGVGGKLRLVKVQDETTVLLQVSYSAAATVCAYFPGQAREAHEFRLYFRNGRLSELKQGAQKENVFHPLLTWQLGYDEIKLKTPDSQAVSWSVLTQVKAPTGLTERVYYQNDGHTFPQGAPFQKMPYVHRVVQTPGFNQPSLEKQYRFSDKNFLGYQGGFERWEEDQDNLYRTGGDYTFTSTETRLDNGQPFQVITRGYNQFHLLTEEMHQQHHKKVTKTLTYHAKLHTTFKDQPAQFQCPRQMKECYEDTQQGTSRTEITTYEFDEWGNPTREVTPTGITTRYDYYPAAGEGVACPSDPHGFLRWLKIKTVTPVTTAFSAPIRSTHYTYQDLAPTGSNRPRSLVMKDSIDKSDGQDSLHTLHTYFDSAQHYGRLCTQQIKFGTYSHEKIFNYTFDTTTCQLIQTCTEQGFDRCQATTTETHSSLTGLSLSTQDAHGVQSQSEYDVLGRAIKDTVASSTAYEANKHYCYQLPDGQQILQPIITITDTKATKIRHRLDGFGRVCQTEQQDVDSVSQGTEAPYRPISQITHDARGRKVQCTTTDWLRTDTGSQAQHTTQTFEYDDWGQRYKATHADGRIELTQHDPIQRITTTSLQGTGKTETTIDDWGNPVQIRQLKADSTEVSKVTMRYDGWGRLREETDAKGYITQFEYDTFDRVIRQTLADHSVVETEYAPHTAEALATRITVRQGCDAHELGTQQFDGLHRLITKTVGGRRTPYIYEGANPHPATVTTPRGDTLTYTYEPQLAQALVRATAPSNTQNFDYDHQTGDLLKATQGNTQQQLTYYPSGLLKTKTHPNLTGASKTSQYTYSLGGKLQRYTDVLNQLQTHQYDIHGRLIQLSDTRYKVTIDYDTLSRLHCIRTTDKTAQLSATREITYDDWDRPVGYTYKLQDQTLWTLQQTYYPNSQLATKVMRSGNQTLWRDERYQYDARHRLVHYTCTGTQLPQDPQGRHIQQQAWTYDALNNLRSLQTTFEDQTVNWITYDYHNQDPTQVSKITQTNPSKTVNFTYDVAGHLIQDEVGRTFEYDTQGRLTAVTQNDAVLSEYYYDALNVMVGQTFSGARHELFYQGDTITHEIQSESEYQRCLRLGGLCLAQEQKAGDTTHSYLMGSDGQHSLLTATTATSQPSSHEATYTPYGHQSAVNFPSHLGFNGERLDPVTGCYHLGKGYRAYNPTLGFLYAPDSWSPFGAGGINPYAYCLGDPVNRIDPTGHFSFLGLNDRAWILIGIGTVVSIGVALAIPTEGFSLAVGGFSLAVGKSSLAVAEVMANITASVATDVGVGAIYDLIDHGKADHLGEDALSGLIGGVHGGVVSLGTKLGRAGIRALEKQGSVFALEMPELLRIPRPRLISASGPSPTANVRPQIYNMEAAQEAIGNAPRRPTSLGLFAGMGERKQRFLAARSEEEMGRDAARGHPPLQRQNATGPYRNLEMEESVDLSRASSSAPKLMAIPRVSYEGKHLNPSRFFSSHDFLSELRQRSVSFRAH